MEIQCQECLQMPMLEGELPDGTEIFFTTPGGSPRNSAHTALTNGQQVRAQDRRSLQGRHLNQQTIDTLMDPVCGVAEKATMLESVHTK